MENIKTNISTYYYSMCGIWHIGYFKELFYKQTIAAICINAAVRYRALCPSKATLSFHVHLLLKTLRFSNLTKQNPMKLEIQLISSCGKQVIRVD